MSVCRQDEGRKKQQQGRNDVSVHSVNCYTESTYTPARLKALVQKLPVVIIPQPLSFVPFVRFVPSVPSKIRSPSFFASDCVRNPSRCFVKKSAVFFFVSTRLTDRRFSRIHCCIAKHCISMCLSPPGPLRRRMCLAESESISRRTETL